jgi:hypothetical protein
VWGVNDELTYLRKSLVSGELRPESGEIGSHYVELEEWFNRVKVDEAKRVTSS